MVGEKLGGLVCLIEAAELQFDRKSMVQWYPVHGRSGSFATFTMGNPKAQNEQNLFLVGPPNCSGLPKGFKRNESISLYHRMVYKIFSIDLKEKELVLGNFVILCDDGVIRRNYVKNMYLLRTKPVTEIPPVKGA